MNIELMQAHVAQFLTIELPEILEDGSNLGDFFCADVVGNRRFAQNYGGYPRSEIAEINAQASLQQAQNLLNDLVVYDGNYLNGTPEEIMLSHKSKYIQAPSEMIDFIERQLQIRDAKNAHKSQSTDGLINFTDTPNPEKND